MFFLKNKTQLKKTHKSTRTGWTPCFRSDGPDLETRPAPVAFANCHSTVTTEEAEPRRPNLRLPPGLPHGVAAAWASGVVGDPEPKAPWRAGDPRRRGELAPGVGPRRGAPVPAAPPPPPPPPLRHLPMRRPPRGGHTARDAAARQQGSSLPAEQVGAAAAGHLHLAAQ
jgi:hypothetical protein